MSFNCLDKQYFAYDPISFRIVKNVMTWTKLQVNIEKKKSSPSNDAFHVKSNKFYFYLNVDEDKIII